MSLFSHLPDRIFAPLSGPNKHMFELVLLTLYSVYYSTNQEPPTRDDVTDTIKEVIRARPDLWQSDDDGDRDDGDHGQRTDAWNRARRALNHLEACGWLEFNKSGYKVQVEFSPSALSLLQSLVRINDGKMIRLEGVMRALNAILEKLQSGQDGYATTLGQCADQLNEIYLTMRATKSKLARIRTDVFKLRGSAERFKFLIDKYVTEIFQHDIAHLMSDGHPYRLKSSTLAVIDGFLSDRAKMAQLGYGIAVEQFAQIMREGTPEERLEATSAGVELARKAFEAITLELAKIEDVARSIMELNSKINTQLTVQGTMRVKHRRGDPQRVETLLSEFGRHLAKATDFGKSSADVPAVLAERSPYIGEAALRLPVMRREPKATRITHTAPDPLAAFRNKLTDDYLKRIAPSAKRLEAFLDRMVGDANEAVLSDDTMIEVDDFLAASVLLRHIFTGDMPSNIRSRFTLVCDDVNDLVDTKFMQCPRFTVHRVEEMKDAA